MPISTKVMEERGLYTIYSNDCDKQFDYIFLHKHRDESNLPVGDWTRTLNKNEEKLVMTQEECLSVASVVTLSHQCLGRARSTIRTDHEALQWRLAITDVTGRLA